MGISLGHDDRLVAQDLLDRVQVAGHHQTRGGGMARVPSECQRCRLAAERGASLAWSARTA